MTADPPALIVWRYHDGRLCVRTVDAEEEFSYLVTPRAFGTLWRQFLVDRQPCTVCGRILVRRQGALYCSDSCKSRAWRTRQRHDR